METRRLQHFVDIVNAGSISKAAVLAGVAQAALSQQLGILENEFRCTLLVRSRSGVQLTPAGQVLYREAQALLRRTADLKDLVKREATEISGVVSLGLTAANINLLVADLLPKVRTSYPGIQLRIHERMTGDLADGIVQGQFDLATLAQEESRAGVESRKVYSEALFAVAATALSPGAETTLVDLARLPLILPTGKQTLRGRYDTLFAQAGTAPLVVAETDSVHAMKAAVLAGTGLAILPRSLWRQEEAAGRVRLTAITDQQLRIDVWLATRGPPQSEAIAAVAFLVNAAFARASAGGT